jgi:mRNA interferase MazF
VEVGVERFEVHLVNLDPTVGAEIQKLRPCVVISPDEMNRSLRTVIIAPMTTVRRKHYPSRVECVFQKTRGQVGNTLQSITKSNTQSFAGNV